MMNLSSVFKLTSLLALSAFIFAGCGSDSNPASPLANFQPEIVNNQDAFSFQVTAIENVTTVVSYTWANSGTQAVINHSSTVDSGSVAVIIFDNDGSQVYGNPLVASLNENSSVGVAGSWTITVTLVNAYGTLNFRADKL